MRLSSFLACLVLSVLVVGTASAATWNVAQTGCSDVTCTPCCTIQGAVGHASGGDTISVSPGTYPENLDFRNMASVGDLTLESALGPGTVLVSPASGRGLIHAGAHTNTVTVTGVDFTSPDMSCIFLAHSGNVVLTDVTASPCGYHSFEIDATGTVTMERCTGNNSGQTGIQIDGASSASLTDCTGSSNPEHGISIYAVPGLVNLVNPTTTGNTFDGIKLDLPGDVTMSGATVTDNGRFGIHAAVAGTVEVLSSTVTGNANQGIYVEMEDIDPVDGFTLTQTDVINNGHTSGDDGVSLREIGGLVVITGCNLDNNGSDGVWLEDTVTGDVEITGGRANGNGSRGFNIRSSSGSVTVIGAMASNNDEKGFSTNVPGTVYFRDCIANGNDNGSGLDLQWQDPDPLDAATVINCTALNNGLSGSGNGIRIKESAGPVTVVGTTTNGNYWTGLRVDGAADTLLIRGAESNYGLENGIKIDAETGLVKVTDCVADGNAVEGLLVNREDIDVEALVVERNTFIFNSGPAVSLNGLSASGTFKLECNDIAGNTDGLTLNSPVTVDARRVWWGDPSGPSGDGPGTGDTIWAGGGVILHDPWLLVSFSAPASGCPFFTSDLETGSLAEWDSVSP
jgi:hypothetical protein